jgi:tRNA(Ile)-lysidine synthase
MMGPDLRTRLLAHIRNARLFPRRGVALVAVSGGTDSVALLDLLASLAPELGLELAVAHVEHGISDEASAAAPWVSEWARRYSLPCYVEQLRLGPEASETLAREARYQALRRMQRRAGAQYLVTAHQADDQAETVLYRVLKGTGVIGLTAIPERGPRGLVRPLLPFGRQELTTWLERQYPESAERPALFDDPANADPRHDRAWLRHAVMPQLRERFGPELEGKLARTVADARAHRRAWGQLLRALPELEFRREVGRVEVARAPLARYDKVLSEALLRALAREIGSLLGPRRAAALREFVMRGNSGRRFELGAGCEAELSFGRLFVRAARREAIHEETDVTSWGEGEQGSVRWLDWAFTWQTAIAAVTRRSGMSTWVTPGPGQIRMPQAGDRMMPLGGVGRRKVRRLLMEARIPTHDRQHYPVVVRGSDIIWIPGICRSAAEVPRAGEMAVRLDARASAR